MLYSEAWAPLLSPSEISYRLNLSVYTHNCAMSVLGTPKLIEFLVSEVNGKKNAYSSSLKTYASNEYFADAPQELKDLILNSRLHVYSYKGVSNEIESGQTLSGFTYLKNFRARLEILQIRLANLQPYMEFKSPPFNIPPKTLSDNFVDSVPARFEALKNALNGTLGFHRKWLSRIETIALDVKTQQYRSSKLALYLTFFALFLIFLAGSFWNSLDTNSRLFRIISTFSYLKPEEIVIQKLVLEKRLETLRNSKYDELTMIDQFYLSPQLVLTDQIVKNSLKKSTNQTKSTNGLSSIKVKKNFTFRSFKVTILLTILSTLIIVYFWVILQTQSSILNSVIEMMSFYMETYNKFRDASDYYMYHSILTIFGNFIPIEGELAQDVILRIKDQGHITNLVNFVNQRKSTFATFFGQEKGENIENALYKNLCSHLDNNKITYPQDSFVCSQNFFASQGFVAFMNNEKDVLYNNRLMIFDHPTFLESTKTNWLVFPFLERLFLTSSLNFRISHKLVYETMMGMLLSAGQDKILSELERVRSLNTKYFQAPSYIMITVYAVILLAVSLHSINRDLAVCAEIFYNMLPSVIYQNKLVYRELQMIHVSNN